MNAVQLALTLVELTLADGAKVHVNPTYVIKVYPTAEAMKEGGVNKYVASGAKCIVTFADGKFNAVLEQCDVVRKKLEGRMR